MDSTRALLIAVGNPLRGDDAAAHHLAEAMAGSRRFWIRREHQLMPEIAPELTPFGVVVFADADTQTRNAVLECLVSTETPAPLERSPGSPISPLGSHHVTPEAVLQLASQLFGWRGAAWLCRLPVQHFEPGAPLSAAAAGGVRAAALLLKSLVPRRGHAREHF